MRRLACLRLPENRSNAPAIRKGSREGHGARQAAARTALSGKRARSQQLADRSGSALFCGSMLGEVGLGHARAMARAASPRGLWSTGRHDLGEAAKSENVISDSAITQKEKSGACAICDVLTEKDQPKAFFLTPVNRRILPKVVFSIRLNIYSGNLRNMMRTLFFGNAR